MLTVRCQPMLTERRHTLRPDRDPDRFPPAIETTALTKRYGTMRGIEALSLSVQTGEVFGFLGANGAGKTTLIRTLLDLQRPTSGSARRARTRQSPRLDRDPGPRRQPAGRLRVRRFRSSGDDLLRYLARLRGMRGLGRARELAERFDADLDRPLGHLSRGNRQKVGPDPGDVPRARAADPRRAHQRARSDSCRRPSSTLAGRGARGRAGPSSCPRTTSPRCSASATAWRSSRTGACSRSRPSASSRDARWRKVSDHLRRAAEPRLFESIPGVRDLQVDGERTAALPRRRRARSGAPARWRPATSRT